MEFELVTKLLAGGGGITAAIWALTYIIKEIRKTVARLEKMHNEGMVKLDKHIEVTNGLLTQVAIHNQRFSHGEERMDRIEDRLKTIGERAHKISNEVLKLEARIERISRND